MYDNETMADAVVFKGSSSKKKAKIKLTES